jgi:hypothetical protein
MGYTTDFDGSLKISRALTRKQTEYINCLGETRRMKRDVNVLMSLYKGKHGNPFAKDKTNAQEVYGHEGEFFAMDDGDAGQRMDGSVLDQNCPPGQKGFMQGRVDKGQPGLWCQWSITEDGDKLQWNGGEKFYNYIEWLNYLIKMFFIPWGRKLNGEISWYGEDRSDMGKIKVRNNEVFIFNGEVTFPDEDK